MKVDSKNTWLGGGPLVAVMHIEKDGPPWVGQGDERRWERRVWRRTSGGNLFVFDVSAVSDIVARRAFYDWPVVSVGCPAWPLLPLSVKFPSATSIGCSH